MPFLHRERKLHERLSKLVYLANFKAFAFPQLVTADHREHSVNDKGADVVNEGMVSLVTRFDIYQCFGTQSHGRVK